MKQIISNQVFFIAPVLETKNSIIQFSTTQHWINFNNKYIRTIYTTHTTPGTATVKMEGWKLE